ncbi:MAG: aromatic amino acid lyase, partial [Pseudomonadota bacterium]
MKPQIPSTVVLGTRPLRPADVWEIAHQAGTARLDPSPQFRERIEAGSLRLRERLAAGERIYGVTTGFGESVVTEVPAALTDDLAVNLLRFHGCGTGAAFTAEEAAAVVLVRTGSL